MNYHNITTDDMLNGDGLRVVLWVSGCSHGCKGCHNPQTWDENSGIKFDDESKKELFEKLSKDYISGLTISGGDPLHWSNVDCVLSLIKEIKLTFPDKTIWLYTGDEVKSMELDDRKAEIFALVDVIVDGTFEMQLCDPNYHWAGSTNQRVWRDLKGETNAGN